MVRGYLIGLLTATTLEGSIAVVPFSLCDIPR